MERNGKTQDSSACGQRLFLRGLHSLADRGESWGKSQALQFSCLEMGSRWNRGKVVTPC